jgi:3-isopropylmalate dehydrogenase
VIKVKKRKILLLPGDGIGPEVVGEVKKLFNGLIQINLWILR